MTVTVAEVRSQLNEVEADLIPDANIDQQINIAGALIDAIKGDNVSDTNRDYGVILLAAYLVYLGYVAKYVGRAQGRVPMAIEVEARRLKEIADQFILTVIEGRPPKLPPTVIAGKRWTYDYYDEYTD